MLRVVLIRPGSTDYDEQGRIMGRLDIPLSELGSTQVSQTAGELAELSIECIYSAPCSSAIESAQAIAKSLGVKTKTLSSLLNFDPGLWEGKLIEEVKSQSPKIYRRWQEHPETICPPQGEMLNDAQQRLSEVVSKLCRKKKQGVVGLVVPEPLASVLCAMLKQEHVGDLWEAERTCGVWESFEVAPSHPMVAG